MVIGTGFVYCTRNVVDSGPGRPRVVVVGDCRRTGGGPCGGSGGGGGGGGQGVLRVFLKREDVY